MDSLFDGATRSYAELSQTTIGYSEGPNHGPPLLLIHGLTVRRESFAPVIAELMKKFHVFAIDQRGHGQSGHPDTGYTFTNYSSDAAEFIEKVIGENSLIWGHSLGAGTAIVTAHRCPDRVRVTSVKVVYEAFCVILFPMIVYTASAIACTSFSVSPSMRAADRSASDSVPM